MSSWIMAAFTFGFTRLILRYTKYTLSTSYPLVAIETTLIKSFFQIYKPMFESDPGQMPLFQTVTKLGTSLHARCVYVCMCVCVYAPYY